MAEIPEVPPCPSEETPCDAYAFIEVGKHLLAADKETNCPKALDGLGVAIQDANGVKFRTGEATDPIKLPKVQTTKASFPFLFISNKAGVMMRVEPNQLDKKYHIISKNGSFELVEFLNEPCFREEDVCSDCEPEFIAGLRIVDGKACLVRFPLSVTSDFWEDSNCIQITGSGTEEDPYVANITISEQEGNILQCLPDGLYAAEASS